MSMFNIIRKEFQYGQYNVVLETGRVARQANSVLITMGGVSVLVAVVAQPTAKAGQDFFPLTVNYQEKQYAAGRIPGGYGKREGRASEAETLISRFIDRPIRPLFPEGYYNEIQVTATVISSDKTMEADIAAMLGTSAALAIAGTPFRGPIGGGRRGSHEQCREEKDEQELVETIHAEIPRYGEMGNADDDKNRISGGDNGSGMFTEQPV